MTPKNPLQDLGGGDEDPSLWGMQSPSAQPTLREQAALRASATSEAAAVAVVAPPPPQHQQQQQHHHHLVGSSPFQGVPQTPTQTQASASRSHPLASPPSSLLGGASVSASGGASGADTPEFLAQSARKEWQRHHGGGGLTQTLEDKRVAQDQLPGRVRVRVLSAEERRDVSGAKYTAYIVQVQVQHQHQQKGSTVVELEHRYSEFAKLHDLLQRHSSSSSRSSNTKLVDCAFPEKHWAGRLGQWTPSLKWAPSQHQDLVGYRKVQLDIWLVHMVEQYNLGTLPHQVHQAVYDFLTHSDRPPCDQENTSLWMDSSSKGGGAAGAAEQWTRLHNPLSFTLGSTIRQATAMVQHMLCSGKGLNESDQSIPLDLLQCAKGLCFLTVIKAGLVISGRVGTGLLIARIDQDRWSAPCALGTVGVGWGMQAGGDITQYLVVLTTIDAVDALLGGTVQLGAELGVAVGPVGRGATSQVGTGGNWSVHPAYSYAHSQGLFLGMSLEGSVLTTRGDVNAKFYGQPWPASHILDLPPPRAAEPLYQALRHAVTMEIPEEGLRPSQLFQDKCTIQNITYANRKPTIPTSPTQPDIDAVGRVTLPSDHSVVSESEKVCESYINEQRKEGAHTSFGA